MSTATADLHDAPAESGVNYLNASYGIKSWLLTTDHKRIGLLYLAVDHLQFLRRRHRRRPYASESHEPQGALVAAGDLQQALLHPRHHHGIFLPRSFDPRDARKFSDSLDDRGAGRRLPQAQSAELVSLRRRLALRPLRRLSGGVDTGWTFYTPYSSTYSHTAM